jgi:maleate isomerase
VAYGCTSGTISAGIDQIINKIQSAKPNCKVITPITSAVKALKHLDLKKSQFLPLIHKQLTKRL